MEKSEKKKVGERAGAGSWAWLGRMIWGLQAPCRTWGVCKAPMGWDDLGVSVKNPWAGIFRCRKVATHPG